MINIRHVRSVFLIALLSTSSLCAAATEAPTSVQETGGAAVEKIKKRNRSFEISVESVLQRQRQNQKLFLVDIRSRESYDKIRIPGSINLPLHAVKAKAFLKTHPVVLVHEGYGYRRMERECKVLWASGFRIRILNGGLNAWQAHGGPLEGDPFLRKNLNKMMPQAFYLEKDADNWMVLDAAAVQDAASRMLIPSAIHIPILKDPKAGSKKLENTARKQRRHPFLSILIFNETGTEYDRIEKMIPKKDLYTLFFLSGGFEGYQRFLQNLSLSRKPKESRIKTVGKCKPCVQKKGQPDDK